MAAGSIKGNVSGNQLGISNVNVIDTTPLPCRKRKSSTTPYYPDGQLAKTPDGQLVKTPVGYLAKTLEGELAKTPEGKLAKKPLKGQNLFH